MFGEPFVPPVSDGSGQDRALLRRASQLLQEAGYVIKDGKRIGPDGERISIEFLLDEPSFQPHHMPYIKNLSTLGIDAKIRMVDPVQMQQRRNEFDFDITIQRFGFSATPGDSLRSYFSSQAAALKGSQNLAGIADPAIDAMIEHVIAARIAGRTDDRLPRARPADPRRALLDSALVQGVALDRLLGYVRPPARPSRATRGASWKRGGTTRTRRPK